MDQVKSVESVLLQQKEEQKSSQVQDGISKVPQGKNFIIGLPLSPNSGFSWKPIINSDSVKLTGAQFAQPPNPFGIVDMPGAVVYQFKAVKPGFVVLSFQQLTAKQHSLGLMTFMLEVV